MPGIESGGSSVYDRAHLQQGARAGQTRCCELLNEVEERRAPSTPMTLTKGAANNVFLTQNRAREARNDKKWTKSNDFYIPKKH